MRKYFAQVCFADVLYNYYLVAGNVRHQRELQMSVRKHQQIKSQEAQQQLGLCLAEVVWQAG